MKPTTEINTTIDYRKIGVHLKEARKANSLSQAQVAASLRISVCAYGNLERGSQRLLIDAQLSINGTRCRSRKHFGRLHTEARAL